MNSSTHLTSTPKRSPFVQFSLNILLVVFSLFIHLIIYGLLWDIFVAGVLFLCTDPVPILDFFPPWVHAFPGDFYIASQTQLVQIWGMFLIGLCISAFWFIVMIKIKGWYKKLLLSCIWIGSMVIFVNIFNRNINAYFLPIPNLEDQKYTEAISSSSDGYFVAYRIGNGESKAVYIGNSPLDLRQYDNEHVHVTIDPAHSSQGENCVLSKQQCVNGSCQKFTNGKGLCTVDVVKVTQSSDDPAQTSAPVLTPTPAPTPTLTPTPMPTPTPLPVIHPAPPLTCKTLNTEMVTDPKGFGYIGCDMEVTSGQIDLNRSYCESQTTHQKEFLVPDAYGRRDRYWTTLTSLDPKEIVKVFAVSPSGKRVECSPDLNQ